MNALEECLPGIVQREFEGQTISRNIKTDLKVGNGIPWQYELLDLEKLCLWFYQELVTSSRK